jgi:plastocyanin
MNIKGGKEVTKMEDMVKGKSLFRLLAVMLPVLISLSLVFTTSCRSSEPITTPPPTTTPQAANEIIIEGRGFFPFILRVSVGTTVTWINLTDEDHDVRSNDGLFTGSVNRNGTFSYTFKEPGTFTYVCQVHEGMDGTVIVE